MTMSTLAAAPSALPVSSGSPIATEPIPGLGGPAETLTRGDLERFVALAYARQITVAQAAAFFDKLSSEQTQAVRELIDVKAAVNKRDGIMPGPASPQRGGPQHPLRRQSAPSDELTILTAGGLAWIEPIENRWWASPGTYEDYWWSDQYTCDDKVDTDYIFHFALYSGNPAGLRWTTDNPAVYSYAASRYGGNFNGLSWSFNDAFLCVGDNGIYFFGVYGFGDFTYLTPNN